MNREAQRQLYQGLKAYKFELELTRGIALSLDRKILDSRIAAVSLLLESLSQAPGLNRPASQAVQTQTSSLAAIGPD
jgi:hypothetical protein